MSNTHSTLTSLFSDIADAIRAKTGGTADIVADDFPSAIDAIPTGGGGASAAPDDVNFYDYDGTIVASYSASDFANLTAMPGNPSHSGLTAQGWNWSLSDAKTCVSACGKLNIGQMYITDDGATRLYIRIANKGRMTLPLFFSQTVADGVTIDWGDGSATQTMSGTGNRNTYHVYTDIGDYVISLTPASGCTLGLGNGSNTTSVFGGGNNGRVYQNMLKKVEVGSGVTSIGNYAFNTCSSLASITIPSGVTSIGSYAFNACYPLAPVTIPSGVTSIDTYAFSSCYSLASVTIPNGVTSISANTFNNCYSLASVTIPNGVTSISANAFRSCYSLASVTIPSGVTSIGSYAFANCYGTKEYHIKPTSPPTLTDSNTFNNIPSDCVIYVPAGSLSAYQSASHWSTYASNMQEE